MNCPLSNRGFAGTLSAAEQKSELCGKFKICRAHQDDATPLPAASLREKCSVLVGPEFAAYFRTAIQEVR